MYKQILALHCVMIKDHICPRGPQNQSLKKLLVAILWRRIHVTSLSDFTHLTLNDKHVENIYISVQNQRLHLFIFFLLRVHNLYLMRLLIHCVETEKTCITELVNWTNLYGIFNVFYNETYTTMEVLIFSF